MITYTYLFIYRSSSEKEIEEGEASGADEGDVHPLVTVTKIDPSEIPEVKTIILRSYV